jgi:hypothetical protein
MQATWISWTTLDVCLRGAAGEIALEYASVADGRLGVLPALRSGSS